MAYPIYGTGGIVPEQSRVPGDFIDPTTGLPAYSTAAARTKRLRAIAEALRQQGQHAPEGEMQRTGGGVAGFGVLPDIYVAPSWTQRLNQVASNAVGLHNTDLADQEEAAADRRAREEAQAAIGGIPSMTTEEETATRGPNDSVLYQTKQALKPAEQYAPELMKWGMQQSPDNPYMEGVRGAVLKQALDMQENAYKDRTTLEKQRLAAEKVTAAKVPMSILEWQAFQDMTPEQQDQYLTMKRSPAHVDLGGSQAVLGPQGGIKENFPKTLPPQDIPENAGAKAHATAVGSETGKHEVDLQTTRPQATARIATAEAKTDLLNEAISTAKQQADSWFTTGLAAQLTKGYGGFPAHNLAATLETIKANLGFDELAEMRANSPTGGALGQVAVQEIQFLQAVIANVEQSQTAKQLIANLEKVQRAKQQSMERIKAAYFDTYGVPYQGQPTPGNGYVMGAPGTTKTDILEGTTTDSILNPNNKEGVNVAPRTALPRTTGGTERKTIGGKTYEKRGGQWYPL